MRVLAILSSFVLAFSALAQEQSSQPSTHTLLKKSERNPNGAAHYILVYPEASAQKDSIGVLMATESFKLLGQSHGSDGLYLKIRFLASPSGDTLVGWIRYKAGRFSPEPIAGVGNLAREIQDTLQGRARTPCWDQDVFEAFVDSAEGNENTKALRRELDQLVGLSIEGKRTENWEEIYKLVQAGKSSEMIEKEKRYVTKDGKVSLTPVCCVGFHDTEQSQCAHCLSHFFGFNWGATCGGAPGGNDKWRDRSKPTACIRVNEIFAFSPQRGEWLESSAAKPIAGPVLIFAVGPQIDVRPDATVPRTYAALEKMKKPPMSSGKKKHIGVYLDGFVWHYSNQADMWVRAPLKDFQDHYGAETRLFWGLFPNRSRIK